MVFKPTAISYVLLSSGIALIFWSDGPVLCQFGHTFSSSYVKYLEHGGGKLIRLRSSMFFFILFFNKWIHFTSFLGGSWTCLDFSFLPLPAALDCTIFLFSLFFFYYLSFTSISHIVSMNDKTHPSVKCNFKFVSSGLNLTIVQSETTFKLY